MAFLNSSLRSLLGLRGQARSRIEDVEAHEVARTDITDQRGRSLVARVRDRGDVHAAVGHALTLLAPGGNLLRRGESPLILPRFGSGPAPYSTAPDFLGAVVRSLSDAGAGTVRVLDLRGPSYPEPGGLEETCERAGCDLLDARDGPWVRVRTSAGPVVIPRVVHESRRLVLLPCPLVNNATRFTMGLALSQELLHPRERPGLRTGSRDQKLAGLNLASLPWLVLMDARRALISEEGGGVTREPGLIIASGDLIALDIAALKVLKGYPAKNRLDIPLWTYPQITEAIRLGLGAPRDDRVRILEA